MGLPVSSISVSDNESTPQFKYRLHCCATNENNFWSPETKPVVVANAGLFAFFAEEGNNNLYKIYSVGQSKWLTYTPLASYSGGAKSFVTFTNDKAEAKPFQVTYGSGSGGTGFLIKGLRTDNGVGNACNMNWFGGIPGNTDNTVGRWRDKYNDVGSVWVIEK